MDLRVLEELGLSEAEAKIYLALLRLGQSKTGRIIDVTKLQSSTVYHVLGSLLEKGIVTSVFKGKVKHFRAESPSTLLAFLEEKRKKLAEILPELREMEQVGMRKQHARVYEGLKGVLAAFNDILETMKKGEEYYFFQFPLEKLQREDVQRFFRNYHLKRASLGIKVRGIADPACEKIMKGMYELPLTRLKYVPHPAPTVVVIYKGKTLFLDWDEIPTAIMIESETIYESHKRFFERVWEG